MSLRGALAATKQSPVSRGDCFATCARNDMQTTPRKGMISLLRQLQSQTQEELNALLPSVLAKAFKGEL